MRVRQRVRGEQPALDFQPGAGGFGVGQHAAADVTVQFAELVAVDCPIELGPLDHGAGAEQ